MIESLRFVTTPLAINHISACNITLNDVIFESCYTGLHVSTGSVVVHRGNWTLNGALTNKRAINADAGAHIHVYDSIVDRCGVPAVYYGGVFVNSDAVVIMERTTISGSRGEGSSIMVIVLYDYINHIRSVEVILKAIL